jgi:hypothetical protein
VVLHARQRRDPPRLGDLPAGDVADPEAADQPLLLQPRQRLERLGEGALLGLAEARQPQVGHVQRVEAEVLALLLHRPAQVVGTQRLLPAAFGRPPGADPGDDHQVLGIGVQRLADEVVDDVRAVQATGVDVVDAQLDGPAQDGERRIPVGRRPEEPRPGELHAAEAHPVHGPVAEGDQSGARCSGRHAGQPRGGRSPVNGSGVAPGAAVTGRGRRPRPGHRTEP